MVRNLIMEFKSSAAESRLSFILNSLVQLQNTQTETPINELFAINKFLH